MIGEIVFSSNSPQIVEKQFCNFKFQSQKLFHRLVRESYHDGRQSSGMHISAKTCKTDCDMNQGKHEQLVAFQLHAIAQIDLLVSSVFLHQIPYLCSKLHSPLKPENLLGLRDGIQNFHGKYAFTTGRWFQPVGKYMAPRRMAALEFPSQSYQWHRRCGAPMRIDAELSLNHDC